MEGMEQETLIDTDIIIGALRGTLLDADYLRSQQETGITISSITAYELLYGALRLGREPQLAATQKLLERVRVIDFSTETAWNATKLQATLANKGMILDVRDVFIAATALEKGLALKTHNKKHFSRIDGLSLL